MAFREQCRDFMHKASVKTETKFLDDIQTLLDRAHTTEFEFRAGRVLISNKKPAQQSSSILDKIGMLHKKTQKSYTKLVYGPMVTLIQEILGPDASVPTVHVKGV